MVLEGGVVVVAGVGWMEMQDLIRLGGRHDFPFGLHGKDRVKP